MLETKRNNSRISLLENDGVDCADLRNKMQLDLTKKPSVPDRSCDSNHPILSQTFSHTSKRLPTIALIKSHIYTDRQWIETGDFDRKKQLLTMMIRESYVGQSFVLLTDEFIKTLQRVCADFTSIVEIGAGIGWLGHWLSTYGVVIQTSIDNKTWPDFPQDRYLDIVQQMDSLDYLHLHPEVELFILSWPEEDYLASRIWQALHPGQHLLYIGESRDGCTANNLFLS